MNHVEMKDIRKQDYFYSEAIKTLRANIQLSGKSVKTILVTSCCPNEGKSDHNDQSREGAQQPWEAGAPYRRGYPQVKLCQPFPGRPGNTRTFGIPERTDMR